MSANVPATIDRVLQLLGEEPNNATIGPFRVGDANVRTIMSTRDAMYIPYQYMSLVIGMELTGREDCLLLLPAIINDGLQQVCKPLVVFLVVSLTKGANDLNAPHTMQPRVGLRDFHPRPAVISHRREHILYRQLPGLRPTAATAGDPALVGIASSMSNIASAMHHDLVVRETRYAEEKNPSTLWEKHGDRTADMLLLLTRSTDDEDLSEYYLNVSGKPKGLSERVILQREVDAAAQVLDLMPFQVTPSQVIAMKTFDFMGASYSEIGTGVLPFSITPAGATSNKDRAAIRADRGRAETFDLSGDSVNGAMATNDATRMQNYKGYVASDWMEARLRIRSVACIMGSLVGTTHPALMCYKVFLRKYDLIEPRVQREFELVHRPRLGPALMVFHVQLMWRRWLAEQISRDTHMNLPDFCTGLGTLEQNNNLSWVPSCANVPQLQALMQVARPAGGTQQTHRVGTASGSHNNSGGGMAAGRVGVPTSGATTVAPLPATRARVRIPARKREFTGTTDFAVNVRS
jgi:hypothetical protein